MIALGPKRKNPEPCKASKSGPEDCFEVQGRGLLMIWRSWLGVLRLY